MSDSRPWMPAETKYRQCSVGTRSFEQEWGSGNSRQGIIFATTASLRFDQNPSLPSHKETVTERGGSVVVGIYLFLKYDQKKLLVLSDIVHSGRNEIWDGFFHYPGNIVGDWHSLIDDDA